MKASLSLRRQSRLLKIPQQAFFVTTLKETQWRRFRRDQVDWYIYFDAGGVPRRSHFTIGNHSSSDVDLALRSSQSGLDTRIQLLVKDSSGNVTIEREACLDQVHQQACYAPCLDLLLLDETISRSDLATLKTLPKNLRR